MTGKLARLREDIAHQYRKHCVSCTGSCCNSELEEGFLAFGWELDRLNKTACACAANNPGGTMLVQFNNSGRCPFSGANACTLDINERPLDCLTYPVYPQVRFQDNGEKKLTSITVRKGCHKLAEITEDNTLLEMVRTFWELELAAIKTADMKEWLSCMAD